MPLEVPKHVDDWIDHMAMGLNGVTPGETWASFFLMIQRLPATLKIAYIPILKKEIKDFKLFCTYEGKRYRVTGASRLGDVWLTANFKQEDGYQQRVDIRKCSNWSQHP